MIIRTIILSDSDPYHTHWVVFTSGSPVVQVMDIIGCYNFGSPFRCIDYMGINGSY